MSNIEDIIDQKASVLSQAGQINDKYTSDIYDILDKNKGRALTLKEARAVYELRDKFHFERKKQGSVEDYHEVEDRIDARIEHDCKIIDYYMGSVVPRIDKKNKRQCKKAKKTLDEYSKLLEFYSKNEELQNGCEKKIDELVGYISEIKKRNRRRIRKVAKVAGIGLVVAAAGAGLYYGGSYVVEQGMVTKGIEFVKDNYKLGLERIVNGVFCSVASVVAWEVTNGITKKDMKEGEEPPDKISYAVAALFGFGLGLNPVFHGNHFSGDKMTQYLFSDVGTVVASLFGASMYLVFKDLFKKNKN